MPTSVHDKQIQALTLAIGAVFREKRRLYAAGEGAYRRGMRTYTIPPNAAGITGEGGTWAEDAHVSYHQYDKAIQELQDLIDILSDHGVTKDQLSLFE